MPARWISGESTLPSLQMAGLAVPSYGRERKSKLSSVSSYMDINPFHRGPTLLIPSKLSQLPKATFSNNSTSEVRLSTYDLGQSTIQSDYPVKYDFAVPPSRGQIYFSNLGIWMAWDLIWPKECSKCDKSQFWILALRSSVNFSLFQIPAQLPCE